MIVHYIVGARATGKSTKMRWLLSAKDSEKVLVITHNRDVGKEAYPDYRIGTPRSATRGLRPQVIALEDPEIFTFDNGVTFDEYMKRELLPMSPEEIILTTSYERLGRFLKFFMKLGYGQEFTFLSEELGVIGS